MGTGSTRGSTVAGSPGRSGLPSIGRARGRCGLGRILGSRWHARTHQGGRGAIFTRRFLAPAGPGKRSRRRGAVYSRLAGHRLCGCLAHCLGGHRGTPRSDPCGGRGIAKQPALPTHGQRDGRLRCSPGRWKPLPWATCWCRHVPPGLWPAGLANCARWLRHPPNSFVTNRLQYALPANGLRVPGPGFTDVQHERCLATRSLRRGGFAERMGVPDQAPGITLGS